jgi:hypothetical protein
MREMVLLIPVLFQLGVPATKPKLEWRQVSSQTFALNATEAKSFRLRQGRWRFEFHADSSIYTGVLTEQQQSAARGRYKLSDFKNFHCVGANVIEATTPCAVGAQTAFLVIRDKRGPISALTGHSEELLALGVEALAIAPGPHSAAAGATAAPMAEMAQRKTLDNKIKVVAYKLVCVESCRAGTKYH